VGEAGRSGSESLVVPLELLVEAVDEVVPDTLKERVVGLPAVRTRGGTAPDWHHGEATVL
jgi:hypothetical protein